MNVVKVEDKGLRAGCGAAAMFPVVGVISADKSANGREEAKFAEVCRL